MLFFATNQKPKPGHVVRLITPQYDEQLNRRHLAIDPKSAQPIGLAEAVQFPWFWKAHAVGTLLDVEVTRRLLETNAIPLGEYWGKHHLALYSGKGFQDVANRTPKPAHFMKDYHELVNATRFSFQVNISHLERSKRRGAFWPRKEAIYKGPLVLIRESPGADRASGWALLSLDSVLYNESFCGYSTAGHPEPELLARYLHLFIHSEIWMHFALLTSAKFGAERRRIYLEDLEDCPIVPLNTLTREQHAKVLALSNRLVAGDKKVFSDIDAFFCGLFGLDELDYQVIHDTLDVGLPYGASRQRAWSLPTTEQRRRFCNRLATVLKPFFKSIGREIRVTPWKIAATHVAPPIDPYASVLVANNFTSTQEPNDAIRHHVLRLGRETGASRIVEKIDNGLMVSILNQYRYWTPSRARLLGIEIVRRYLSVFEG